MSLPAGYKCPTPCDTDCLSSCHERHKPHYNRNHDPSECDQLQLGRDVTPLAPPAFSPWHTQPPPVKMSRILYARALSADRVPWWRRVLLLVRGPRS
ncbi:MAG TPA: hypothetical protein VEV61_13625 [Streptosporangiaceae bacterium]|nr:hypothetical protein [Streptosporangiaceae bacterium]